MTIHLPEDLAESIRAEVLSGHFASGEDVVAAALRDYLERKHGRAAAAHAACTEEEPGTEELQHRLFEAGVISEIKPQITDFTPYRHRQAVPIQGEPLSETIIRERR
jgi:Arc/MetJ-type ribon-helix-helix transcriptional regulator